MWKSLTYMCCIGCITYTLPALAQDSHAGAPQRLLNGQTTTARPEVGTFGFCTGTLIASQYVISASHCFGHHSKIWGARNASAPIFQIRQANGTTTRYPVERVFSYGFPIGPHDVALVRLTTAVPSTVATPARILNREPTNGANVRVFGYGCTATGGSGTKRRRDTTLRIDSNGNYTTRNTLCPGDSGGPIFLGAGANAPIFGVNAQLVGRSPNQTDIYGKLPRVRQDLSAVIRAWSSRSAQDISNTGWCSGPGERAYNGDVNGDRKVDVICHNENSGSIAVATNSARLITPTSTRPGNYCSHRGSELHLGDFNGDRRTDLMCADKRTGDRWVLFAKRGGTRSPYTEAPVFHTRLGFCTHSSGELHTGDFDGDGLTDVLCHDTNNGRKWIDYTRPTRIASNGYAAGLFSGVDWSTRTNYCSHTTARLHVSDFNRDRRSDLLCHTRATGEVDVKLARGQNVFGGSVDFQQGQAQFCSDSDDVLKTWDYSGNGRADLVCLDRNGDGHAETITAHTDRTPPFTIEPASNRAHWSRQSSPNAVVRQWYITETGVANQPDQRDRR